jgi:uncharacterized protein (TIGR03000 family)
MDSHQKGQRMKKTWLALVAMVLLGGASAQAGLFDQGIGSAMYYGPYTGGHGYSYNTAYGYGLSFSPADSWQRDPFAYPAGVSPYRPWDKPIYYTVFPKPAVPYVAVPGPDGLPVLVPSATAALAPPAPIPAPPTMPLIPTPVAAPALKPVPPGPPPVCATIRLSVPDGAEVWFDREKTIQGGSDRVFQSPPLTPGKMVIYTVRAKWNSAGRPVEQFRVVGVRAGETAKVTFSAPSP